MRMSRHGVCGVRMWAGSNAVHSKDTGVKQGDKRLDLVWRSNKNSVV
jgi:hypothetical protein